MGVRPPLTAGSLYRRSRKVMVIKERLRIELQAASVGLHNTCYRTLQVRRQLAHLSASSPWANTIPGWKSVPEMRVAMAMRARCPQKTFTWGALDISGKFTARPL